MRAVLHDMEHVRETYHQSLFVLVKPFLLSALILLVPWYFVSQYQADSLRRILIFWTILVVVYFLRVLMIWRLNTYVVTNKRLIKMSHEGIFQRTVVETPHERILNVSYKTTGFTSVLFRFGDVEVQVVGLVEPIILKNISRPAEIKDYLWLLHTRVVTTQGKYEAEDIAHVQERVGYTKKDQRIL